MNIREKNKTTSFLKSGRLILLFILCWPALLIYTIGMSYSIIDFPIFEFDYGFCDQFLTNFSLTIFVVLYLRP